MKTNRETILAITMLALFLLSFGAIPGTHGRFSQSFALFDSTLSAEFDVVITPPEEFIPDKDGHVFAYNFLTEIDIKGLAFRAANNGDTDVICRPYFDDEITYRVYVAEELITEFIVEAKDVVDFWLILGPNGLDTNLLEVEFIIDIQQWEGSDSQ